MLDFSAVNMYNHVGGIIMKNRIGDLRREKNLTLKQLAEVFGIKDNTLSQYENGKRTPSIDLLYKISNYFNVSFDYLICNTDIRTIVNKFGKQNRLHELIDNYNEIKIISTKLNVSEKFMKSIYDQTIVTPSLLSKNLSDYFNVSLNYFLCHDSEITIEIKNAYDLEEYFMKIINNDDLLDSLNKSSKWDLVEKWGIYQNEINKEIYDVIFMGYKKLLAKIIDDGRIEKILKNNYSTLREIEYFQSANNKDPYFLEFLLLRIGYYFEFQNNIDKKILFFDEENLYKLTEIILKLIVEQNFKVFEFEYNYSELVDMQVVELINQSLKIYFQNNFMTCNHLLKFFENSYYELDSALDDVSRSLKDKFENDNENNIFLKNEIDTFNNISDLMNNFEKSLTRIKEEYKRNNK